MEEPSHKKFLGKKSAKPSLHDMEVRKDKRERADTQEDEDEEVYQRCRPALAEREKRKTNKRKKMKTCGQKWWTWFRQKALC